MDMTNPTTEQPKRRKPGRYLKRKRKLSSIFSLLYFILTFAYIETVFHITEFKNVSVLFPVLFALPFGILAGTVCNLFPEKVARVLRYVISVAVMVWFCVQIVYFHSFQAFLSMSLLGMGDDVFTNFFKTIMLAIWECMIPILLIFLPLVALFLLHKRMSSKRRFNWKKSLISTIALVLSSVLVLLLLPLGGKGDHSAYANFHNNWVLDLSIEKLGVMTTTGLDVKYLFTGELLQDVAPEDDLDVPILVTLPEDVDATEPEESTSATEPAPEDVYNIIPGLDFAAMAEAETSSKTKKIYQYLAGLEPTKKN